MTCCVGGQFNALQGASKALQQCLNGVHMLVAFGYKNIYEFYNYVFKERGRKIAWVPTMGGGGSGRIYPSYGYCIRDGIL